MLQVLDICSVVQDTIRLVRNHSAAKDVTIESRIPAHLPKVNVDPNQLHQVVFNIMLNALQAMPGGGRLTVTARARANDEEPDQGVLEISFTDTGPGIPEEQLRRVFDPFFSNRKNGTMGTGLGLTVSLSMVKGMNGDIQIRSTVGVGTTVTIALPIVERRTGRRNGTLRRGRLLVVDDEPNVRRTLSSFFARRGYKVDTSEDGDEAVRRVEEALGGVPYDVILMDLMLPGIDGVEATERIRACDRNAQILVMTGVTTQEAVYRALEEGARFSFSKPVNFAELFSVVECMRLARANV
jgi:CheY-like chemotaxis protein